MGSFRPEIASPLARTKPYAVPRAARPLDLFLDGNEGAEPSPELMRHALSLGPELLRRYPSAGILERELARRHGVPPERVIVTAGADEGLDRLCRALLTGERAILLPSPTFVMIPHYAHLAGATIVEVPWLRGPYPTGEVLARVDGRTAIVGFVTPNNPTGLAASGAALLELARGAPRALVLVDHAYAEFADEDLTGLALGIENALVLRTFSKAYGLAGLRVGYAIGPAEVIDAMRAAGGPYSVSTPSLAIAARALELPSNASYLAEVKHERGLLRELLLALGAEAEPSQANFVLGRFRDEVFVHEALASLGIAVRRFPGAALLEGALRITCPGRVEPFARLTHALSTALAPQALLFDVDGVLADVSGSYRRAIVETAASFGALVTAADVAALKARGDANNDWIVTQRLLAERGIQAPLAEVTQRFEDLYQGTRHHTGLWESETLLADRGMLERLARRLPLALVTGRPRRDLARFLERHGLAELFRATVCLEDGPTKPRPEPVAAALARLSVTRAWMIGDTPDDVAAARAACVVPLCILGQSERAADPEGSTRALLASGAARVLDSLAELEALLP